MWIFDHACQTNPNSKAINVSGPKVIFFGHNPEDAAIKRRAVAMMQSGFDLTGYMPRRGAPKTHDFPVIDLGETRDNAYLERIAHIFSGAKAAMEHPVPLQQADLLYARNLDMLALAARTKNRLNLKAPLVYECLDVHHRLTGPSLGARLLRKLEAHLLKQTALVVVSSSRFETEHFARYHAGNYTHMLVENRLIEGDRFGNRPVKLRPVPTRPARIRMGWFGNLRCRRSMTALKRLANIYRDDLEIALRGYPARSVFPQFEAEIAELPNVTYEGPYSAPEDLEKIYTSVDVVWACDWYEDGANSLWLLPNRIYEGGYFACPAIAAKGTQTAQWLDEHGTGLLFTPSEDMHDLRVLIDRILGNPDVLEQTQTQLMSLDREVFVEPPTLMNEMYDLVQQSV